MWGEFGHNQQNSGFPYRFSAKPCEKTKKWILKVGLDWDYGDTSAYVPFEKTAFPQILCKEHIDFDSFEEIQIVISQIEGYYKERFQNRSEAKVHEACVCKTHNS